MPGKGFPLKSPRRSSPGKGHFRSAVSYARSHTPCSDHSSIVLDCVCQAACCITWSCQVAHAPFPLHFSQHCTSAHVLSILQMSCILRVCIKIKSITSRLELVPSLGGNFTSHPKCSIPSCSYSPSRTAAPRFRSGLAQRHGMQSWSPMTRHMQTAPCQLKQSPGRSPTAGKQQPRPIVASIGKSQQDKLITDPKSVGVGSQQDRQDVLQANAGKEEQTAASYKRNAEVGEPEPDSGYVDIPRRIAWERLACPGRRCSSLQASPPHCQRSQ